jgi:hypothetical protein
MAHLDAVRQEQGLAPLPFGAALHLGEILWGNIGAADRLGFTAIGPAVNLVSRLEGLCRPLRPVGADLGRGRRRDYRAAGAAGRTRVARYRGALHRRLDRLSAHRHSVGMTAGADARNRGWQRTQIHVVENVRPASATVIPVPGFYPGFGYFGAHFDPGTSFWGLYGVTPVRAVPGLHVDLYYLGIERQNVMFNTSTAGERHQCNEVVMRDR